MQEELHREAEAARAYGLSEDSEYIQKLQKQWWDYADEKKIHSDMLNAALELVDDYINTCDTYESWGTDNAYEARKRQLAILDNFYKQGLISAKDYQDQRVTYEKKAFDAIKDIRAKKLGEQKDAVKAAISVIEDRIDKEIDALEKQKKALRDKNDEEDRALELEKLKDALDAAKRNRNRRVYYEDRGWVWEADQQAIHDAEKDLSDFKTEEQIREIEKQIDAWEEYKKSFTEIPDEYEKSQDALKASMVLQADWEADVMNKRISLQHSLKDAYTATMEAMAALNEYAMNRVSSESGISSTGGGGSGGSSSGSGKTIQDYKNDRSIAKAAGDKAGMDAAHKGAESIREKDGYSGGDDGSKRIPLKKYATGGVSTDTDPAMLRGKPDSPELIFNAADAKKLWAFVHSIDADAIRKRFLGQSMATYAPSTSAPTQAATDQSIHIENLTVRADRADTLVRELRLIKNNR